MERPGQDILSKPSPVEAYASGLSGSVWLLFLGVAVILGSLVYYNAALRGEVWSGLGVLLGT